MKLKRALEKSGFIEISGDAYLEDIKGDIWTSDPFRIKAIYIPEDSVLHRLIKPFFEVSENPLKTYHRRHPEEDISPKDIRKDEGVKTAIYDLGEFLALMDLVKSAYMDLKSIGAAPGLVRVSLGDDWPVQVDLMNIHKPDETLFRVILAPKVEID